MPSPSDRLFQGLIDALQVLAMLSDTLDALGADIKAHGLRDPNVSPDTEPVMPVRPQVDAIDALNQNLRFMVVAHGKLAVMDALRITRDGSTR